MSGGFLANVSAFNILLNAHEGDTDEQHYFMFPSSSSKTYVFFGIVDLLTVHRNNLLCAKKFIFPGFQSEICATKISSASTKGISTLMQI